MVTFFTSVTICVHNHSVTEVYIVIYIYSLVNLPALVFSLKLDGLSQGLLDGLLASLLFLLSAKDI